jgi:hypothetical protein
MGGTETEPGSHAENTVGHYGFSAGMPEFHGPFASGLKLEEV